MSLSPQGSPPPPRQAKLRVCAQDPSSCGHQMGPDTDTGTLPHIMDTATDTHTHVDIHTCTDTRRHTHRHSHMHRHTHTQMHRHTHTQTHAGTSKCQTTTGKLILKTKISLTI